MNDSQIALSVIIIFCIVLVVASFMAKRVQEKRTSSSGGTGYLLAGKSFGLILVTVTTIGFAIGANTTTGISQQAYNLGFSGGWYGYAFVIGLIYTSYFFSEKFRNANISTISQVYGDYYGEDTRLIASVGQIFMNFTLLVAQFVGGGAILNTIMPEYFTFNTGIFVSMVILHIPA